jgi:hypothetical protein
MVLAMTLLPTGFAQAQSQAPQYTTTGSIAGSNAYATGPDADVSNSKNGLRTVTVDAATAIGSIRPLTGVDGSPFPLFPGFPNLIGQWREAGVSFTRMHDLFGVGDYDLHLAPANAGGDQDLATILFGGDQNGTGPLAAKLHLTLLIRKSSFPIQAPILKIRAATISPPLTSTLLQCAQLGLKLCFGLDAAMV